MKSLSPILLGAILSFVIISCEDLELKEPGHQAPKTVTEDLTLPAVTVNKVKLHSEASGPPHSTMIVAIQSGPGNDYRHMLNCRDLEVYGCRVDIYDQRGSGLYHKLPVSFYTSVGIGALDAIYNELRGVISNCRTSYQQKDFLSGHHWCAMIATAYTGKYPDEVQGLAIQEPGGSKCDDVLEFIDNSRLFDFWGEPVNNVSYRHLFLTGKEDEHEILDYNFAMMGGTKNEYTYTELGIFWRLGPAINEGLHVIGMKYKPGFSAVINNLYVTALLFYSEPSEEYSHEWAIKRIPVYNEVKICKRLLPVTMELFPVRKPKKHLGKILNLFIYLLSGILLIWFLYLSVKTMIK